METIIASREVNRACPARREVIRVDCWIWRIQLPNKIQTKVITAQCRFPVQGDIVPVFTLPTIDHGWTSNGLSGEAPKGSGAAIRIGRAAGVVGAHMPIVGRAIAKAG